tara:strand:- start:425 stop:667 length:243 start_codon:yes stop_codon:yes gene_type:complete
MSNLVTSILEQLYRESSTNNAVLGAMGSVLGNFSQGGPMESERKKAQEVANILVKKDQSGKRIIPGKQKFQIDQVRSVLD